MQFQTNAPAKRKSKLTIEVGPAGQANAKNISVGDNSEVFVMANATSEDAQNIMKQAFDKARKLQAKGEGACVRVRNETKVTHSEEVNIAGDFNC